MIKRTIEVAPGITVTLVEAELATQMAYEARVETAEFQLVGTAQRPLRGSLDGPEAALINLVGKLSADRLKSIRDTTVP